MPSYAASLRYAILNRRRERNALEASIARRGDEVPFYVTASATNGRQQRGLGKTASEPVLRRRRKPVKAAEHVDIMPVSAINDIQKTFAKQ